MAETLSQREVVLEAFRILVGGVDFLIGVALFTGDSLDEFKHVLGANWRVMLLLLEKEACLSGFFDGVFIINLQLKNEATGPVCLGSSGGCGASWHGDGDN